MFVSSSLDDLGGFEEAWAGTARKHLPGWNEQIASRDVMGMLSVLLF